MCYPELGCFEAAGPFSYLDMLPAKPEEINTKFLLYPGHSKRRSGTPPAEINFYDLKEAFVWAKQGFNKTLPTKVLIHGFGSDCSHIWIYEMRSALMAVVSTNTLILSASTLNVIMRFQGRGKRDLRGLAKWGDATKLRESHSKH